MQLNNRWLRQFQPYDAWADLVEEVYMDGDFYESALEVWILS